MNLPNFENSYMEIKNMLKTVGATNPNVPIEFLAKHYSVSEDVIRENIKNMNGFETQNKETKSEEKQRNKKKVVNVLKEDDFGVFEGEFIKFESGKPITLVFSEAKIDKENEVKDPQTNEVKKVPALVLNVVNQDGEDLKDNPKIASITSKRLISLLKPHLCDADYTTKAFKITPTGEGFARNYTLEVLDASTVVKAKE